MRLKSLPCLALVILGIALGWVAHAVYSSQMPSGQKATALRLQGEHQLTSPLLVCGNTYQGDAETLKPLRDRVQAVVDEAKQDGSITQATVYFRYLQTGEEFNLNPDEHYFPASLKKLPLMMQYYKEAEADPTILTNKRQLELTSDSNAGAVIVPKESPIPGQEYSAQELIDYMIKHSDNNSFATLYPALGQEKFDQIYEEMRFDYPNAYVSKEDYVTAYDFSIFFRTLYNATYLTAENSERALQLLSQTDYAQGLVRHLPAEVTVAHKFGVAALRDDDGKEYGELHDCGIVYASNPYLLCIMTKSTSLDIAQVENAIADISAAVYEKVEE